MPDIVGQLARWRVPLGFLFGAAVLWLARPRMAAIALGALIACAGEAIRFWAAGHLDKAREVTKSGPYRLLAHPLYAGSAVMGAGLAIAASDTTAAILIGAYLLFTIGAAIRREETWLRSAFGAEYDRYRRGAEKGTRRFSWQRAMANREYRAVLGLALAIAVLAMKAAWLD